MEALGVAKSKFALLFKNESTWIQELVRLGQAGRPDGSDPTRLALWHDMLSLVRLLLAPDEGDPQETADLDFFWKQRFITFTGGITKKGAKLPPRAIMLSVVNGAPATGLINKSNSFSLSLHDLGVWATDIEREGLPKGGRSAEDARLVYLALLETSLLYASEGRVKGPLMHA